MHDVLPPRRDLESSTLSKSPASQSITPHSTDINELNHKSEFQEKEADAYEVRFEPDDPDNPQNWSRLRKWGLTALAGMLVMNIQFASSAPAELVAGPLKKEFGFSQEVGALLISVYVAGYCVGPLFWGPLSEQYGRRIIGIISFTFYTGFEVGCALSPNTTSLLIFRFLGGIFAASPLTNSGAIIADMWDASTRGKALALYALAPFAGPLLGPIVGGFMTVAGVSWRWVFWLLAIFVGVTLILLVLVLPETYAPVILVRKARQRRKETGDPRWWAPLENRDVPLRQRLETVLARPFKMTLTDPMLFVINLYMSFAYGCIYLVFEAYPIVFSLGHKMNPGISGLMFLPIFLGTVAGCLVYVWYWNPIYDRLSQEYAPNRVPPEFRLDICIYAAPLFALSFFWFGWTSYPSISFWAPMMSGLALGFSTLWIFLGLINYIIDSYLFAAASALAGCTVMRSLFGASFPLLANQMYQKLGPRWASTLLGCIALLMIPIPIVLKPYGPAVKKRSGFSPTARTVDGQKGDV